ncbi:MAG: RNA methyltransferase [Prevotellaceae bacterium]|jgi:tRNA G18 (ribose-2'-O)-methylase SpoU|nr:RNA methyltransferase [Prevotellaceae bacterium]
MSNRKLLNSELKRLTPEEFKTTAKNPVAMILDNIRSQHNIGSAFRTADAFRLERIALCGISSTPPSPEIHKTALGAEDSIDWEYFANTEDAVNHLKINHYIPIAIEQTENSIPLDKFVPDYRQKYALVFGNEVKGVRQSVVDLCTHSIEIPQFGVKHSLNVSVSMGIVLWHFYGHLKSDH